MKILKNIKWKNLALFIVSFGLSMFFAQLIGAQSPKLTNMISYGLGVWAPWVIIKMDWLY